MKRFLFYLMTFFWASTFLIIVFHILTLEHKFNLKKMIVEIIQTDKNHTNSKLKEEDFVRVGWVNNQIARKNSYLNIDEKKKSGVFRIGVFGGSYAAGSEVSSGNDVFSILQKSFETRTHKIEIINFAASAYGMHQSYLMFDYFHKRYDLDYVMFYPKFFHPIRDENFVFNFTPIGPVHSIFIIENGELKEIRPFGKSILSAVFWYHFIIPPLRYLKYSKTKPSILKTLTGDNGRNDVNPFYYLGTTPDQKTTFETYRRLFKQVASKVKGLIILAEDEPILNNLKDLSFLKNIILYDLKLDPRFSNSNSFYQSPCCHRSYLGNKLVVDSIKDLFNKNEISIKRYFNIKILKKRICNNMNLSKSFSNLHLAIDKHKVLTLVDSQTFLPVMNITPKNGIILFSQYNDQTLTLKTIKQNELPPNSLKILDNLYFHNVSYNPQEFNTYRFRAIEDDVLELEAINDSGEVSLVWSNESGETKTCDIFTYNIEVRENKIDPDIRAKFEKIFHFSEN